MVQPIFIACKATIWIFFFSGMTPDPIILVTRYQPTSEETYKYEESSSETATSEEEWVSLTIQNCSNSNEIHRDDFTGGNLMMW